MRTRLRTYTVILTFKSSRREADLFEAAGKLAGKARGTWMRDTLIPIAEHAIASAEVEMGEAEPVVDQEGR